MAKIPTMDTKKFLPGLGSGEQHVVGADGVGICIINATLAVNTAQTAAELIAAAPNTGVGAAFGPVVHSLGRAPSVVWAMHAPGGAAVTGQEAAIEYQYCTADNSAVYIWAKAWSGVVRGVGTRIFVMP